MANLVVDHREGRRARNLRENRVRIALVVAAIEGILVLVGAVPWWLVVLLAAAAVTLYVRVRDHRRPGLVQGAWIAAFSQLLVVVVPVAAAVVTALAIVVLVGFALVALVALFRDRR